MLLQRVDELFSAYDRPDSPGCSLAIVQDGSILYARGYGAANLEYDLAITPQTIFHVASVSKQFTAMALALLADAGRLSLDDDVHRFLPELHDFGCPISVRQMLHHTSGLRDQWDLLTLAGWRMDDVITTADVMELLTRQTELNFAPGSEYLYSNSGYTLLGLIVERVSGQSLRQFAQERFFDPLGMPATHFHDDHTEIVKNRAYSYTPVEAAGGARFRHAVLSYATVGASSLFTTVEDLARWDENFYTGAVGGPAVLQAMQTPGTLTGGGRLNYALGLSVSDYRGLKVVEHSGGDAGFRTHLLRFPDQHFSVAILANLSTAKPGRLARQVADVCLTDIFPEPAHPLAEAGAAETPTPFAGLYYNAARNESQRFEARDGKLFWQIGTGLELALTGAGRFQLADLPDLELRFSGEALEIVEPGMTTTFARVTPPAPSAASAKALRDYVGAYTSPELDVTYHVELADGQLGLRRRKHGRVPLTPSVPDGFVADATDYLFERDAQHRVRGFKLTTGRVRNLRFARAG